MLRIVRDWWRGWSNEDLQSLAEKFKGPEAAKPDGWIPITERERRCLRYFNGIECSFVRVRDEARAGATLDRRGEV